MASFIYADGDTAKTPIDLSVQPLNKKLVLVTEAGREIPFLAGKRMNNDAATVKAAFADARANPRRED